MHTLGYHTMVKKVYRKFTICISKQMLFKLNTWKLLMQEHGFLQKVNLAKAEGHHRKAVSGESSVEKLTQCRGQHSSFTLLS